MIVDGNQKRGLDSKIRSELAGRNSYSDNIIYLAMGYNMVFREMIIW